VTTQIATNILNTAALYLLIAVGFGLIYGTVRFFNFAHASVYTVSAYVAYAAANLIGGSVLFNGVLGVLSGTLLGGLTEVVVYRPLRRIGASSVVLLITSLGILLVLQNALSLLFGDDTKSLQSVASAGHVVDFLGSRITPVQVVLLGSAVGASVLLAVGLRLTRLGTVLRAVANDSSLAQSVGIDVDGAVLASFLIGSALAGIGGVLWAYNTALNPQMGFTALLMGVVAAVIGGVGSVSGAIAGAIFVAVTQQIGMWFFPSEWQDVIVFPILLLFLLVRPQGFFGKPLKKATI